MVEHVEAALGDLNAVHLGEIHVEGGRVHVAGASAVDAGSVHQYIQVAALETAQDDIVGDGAFSNLPQAGNFGQRLAHVLGAAFAHFPHLQAFLVRVARRFRFEVLGGRNLGTKDSRGQHENDKALVHKLS